jgi:hypothetical protein
MLNAVHCSDQLISSFVDRIRNSPYTDNTIIVLVSDHLALRNTASSFLAKSKSPNLLTFLINTPDYRQYKITSPGTHYDITPTILDFMGYKINGQIGFGASLLEGYGYLPGKFGEDTWQVMWPTLKAIANSMWNNNIKLDSKGINIDINNLILKMGGRQFNLSSDGVSRVPSSTLFIFDSKTLMLKNIYAYPFDHDSDGKQLNKATLGNLLLKNKEDLALAISRAKNLPGFCNKNIDPSKGCYFFGKPGSDSFISKQIKGNFSISNETIKSFRLGRMIEKIIHERKKLLKVVSDGYPAG